MASVVRSRAPIRRRLVRARLKPASTRRSVSGHEQDAGSLMGPMYTGLESAPARWGQIQWGTPTANQGNRMRGARRGGRWVGEPVQETIRMVDINLQLFGWNRDITLARSTQNSN